MCIGDRVNLSWREPDRSVKIRVAAFALKLVFGNLVRCRSLLATVQTNSFISLGIIGEISHLHVAGILGEKLMEQHGETFFQLQNLRLIIIAF